MDALEQLRLLVEGVGPDYALAIIAAITIAACVLTYAAINRRIISTNSEAQDVVTQQFVKVQHENSELQKRLDGLHDDMAKLREEYAVGSAERARMAEQLDAAHVQAQKAADDLKAANAAMERMQNELQDVRTKLAALEKEKAAEEEALEREKLHTLKLQQQNERMQAQIDELKVQVAQLSGQNEGLQIALKAIRVVTVETVKAEENAA